MAERLPIVSEVVEVERGIWRMAAFSSHHRVELACHIIWDGSCCVAFDPLPWSDAQWPLGPRPLPPDFIVVTNQNHVRDSVAWRGRFPRARRAGFQHGATDPSGEVQDNPVAEADCIPGWRSIPLPGGAGGETAYHCPFLHLMVFGDAVVHLKERGLEILPDKYCQNPRRLRASLRGLPPFGRALFAHGEPLWRNAGEAVGRLCTHGTGERLDLPE